VGLWVRRGEQACTRTGMGVLCARGHTLHAGLLGSAHRHGNCHQGTTGWQQRRAAEQWAGVRVQAVRETCHIPLTSAR